MNIEGRDATSFNTSLRRDCTPWADSVTDPSDRIIVNNALEDAYTEFEFVFTSLTNSLLLLEDTKWP